MVDYVLERAVRIQGEMGSRVVVEELGEDKSMVSLVSGTRGRNKEWIR